MYSFIKRSEGRKKVGKSEKVGCFQEFPKEKGP